MNGWIALFEELGDKAVLVFASQGEIDETAT